MTVIPLRPTRHAPVDPDARATAKRVEETLERCLYRLRITDPGALPSAFGVLRDELGAVLEDLDGYDG